MSDPKMYDVVIVEIKTNKIVSIIGTRLSLEKAELRVITGVSRVNLDAYFVTEIKAGSRKVGQKR